MKVLITMSILAEQIGHTDLDMLPDFLGASSVAHGMQQHTWPQGTSTASTVPSKQMQHSL